MISGYANCMDLQGSPGRPGNLRTAHGRKGTGLAVHNSIREVKKMKEGIHPKYYQATVTCNCGNTFVTGSTKPEIHVEVCSKCHSFYTGQQKQAQARGRIDKFNKKYGFGAKQ